MTSTRSPRVIGRSHVEGAHPLVEDPAPAVAVRAGIRPDATAQSTVTPGVRIASEWAWRLGVIALALYIVARVFAEFAGILVPILIAVMLASLLYPVTDWMADRIPRGLAALATLLGTLLLIVGLLALVGQQSVAGLPELRSQAVDGFA